MSPTPRNREASPSYDGAAPDRRVDAGNWSEDEEEEEEEEEKEEEGDHHSHNHTNHHHHHDSNNNGDGGDGGGGGGGDGSSGGGGVGGGPRVNGHDDSRKRKRPMSVSCELCKQRKVKCDRGQPACGWCARNRQVCEYKERKKPGLRAGYGRELEARLDKLEGVLSTQQHILQQLAAHLPPASHTTSPPLPAATTSPYAPQSQAALFMHTPDMYPTAAAIQYDRLQSHTDRNPQQLHPPHHPQQQQQQQHTSPASISIPLTTAGDLLYTPSNPPVESSGWNISTTAAAGTAASTAADAAAAAPKEGDREAAFQKGDFPPYDLLYALTDLFFNHINTWCPILHRRSTLDALFGTNTWEEADRILLHAIVATTLRFSTDSRLHERSRERYYTTSKQKVLLYGLENSSVKALQALVILALDTVGSSNGPPGWNLLALITRSVVQLGLAVEATSASIAPLFPSIYTLRAMVLPEPHSFIEDESRRRLFWMVFLLDRYATIATAFEFALDDKEIDRKLPCRDDLFARNQPIDTRWFRTMEGVPHELHEMNYIEHLGAFSYYIEIVGILSRIHRFLKKPVDITALSDVELWQKEYRQLDTTLHQWKFSLPSEYGNMSRVFHATGGNHPPVTCLGIMLHITYHTTVIRLHSSAAYPTTRSPLFTPSRSASQRCHTAVEDICALATYVRGHGLLTKLGPPFAFSLWVAARLLLVHGSTIDHHVHPAIEPLVETLREMGRYWKVAERYATLLQRVMDEYRASECAPLPTNGVRETPRTVRILADMRRCASDLDFLISRQPRQCFGAKPVAAGPPARTPAPHALEYLDVFDFFNLPRLPPVGGDGTHHPHHDADHAGGGGDDGGVAGTHSALAGGDGNPEYQSVMDFHSIAGGSSSNENDWLVQ